MLLIKGMEMPKNCWLCPLSVLYEKPREMLFCRITKEEVLRNKIDGNCPLIPIPPHGRLIDAEWLKLLYDDTAYGEDMSRYHVAIPVILANIDDAPTIIEAEEGE